MHRLRVVKSPAEVALLQHACDLTKAGFERVCRFVKPGVNEAEVEAEFAHEFIRRRGGFAYNPIIASGANACVLHYLDNSRPCKNGDLLLLDVGASYANYNADMTRTIPVNGRFSRRQKQVYNAVLRVLRAQIAGLTFPAQMARLAGGIRGAHRPRVRGPRPAQAPRPEGEGGRPDEEAGEEILHARLRPPARPRRA